MKRPRVKLIDTSDFLFPKEVPHEPKPDEAIDSRPHREWVASHDCHACGQKPGNDFNLVEAAHLRKGAGQPKGGDKKDDFWCWPGCFSCHDLKQHTIGEDRFWEGVLKDFDRWRTVLERYGMRSPVAKVREAATEEFRRRYG
jgi:hypothetical protein